MELKIIENEFVKKINNNENRVTNVELVSGKLIDLDNLLRCNWWIPRS